MADSRDFGKIINERRLALGYSLGQLANRMGTTATKVRTWERGDALPDDPTIDQLAEELNMSVGVLRATLPDDEIEVPVSADEEPAAAVAEARLSDAVDTAGADIDEEQPGEPSEGPAAVGTDSEDVEREADPTSAVAGAASPEALPDPVDGDGVEEHEPNPLVDLPTEEVEVVPPSPRLDPAGGLVAGPAVVATAPAPPRIDPNDLGVAESSGLFAPVERFMATVFDAERPYLFWIRVVLILIVFFVFLRILAWAIPEFFDVLKDILDTIESTPSEADPGTQFIDSG